jgi:hypothetical protein
MERCQRRTGQREHARAEPRQSAHLAWCVAITMAAGGVQAQVSILARSGVQAPGFEPGRPIQSIFPAGVDDVGRLGALGFALGSPLDDFAIWCAEPTPSSTMAVCVRELQEFDTSDSFFKEFRFPTTGAGGHVAARVELRGIVTEFNDSAVLIVPPGGPVRIVIREGVYAGDFPPNSQFDDFFTNSAPVWVSPTGNVALRGTARVGFGGVTSDNDSAVWRFEPPPALPDGVLLLREGVALPASVSLPAGAVLDDLESALLANAADRVLASASLRVGQGGVTTATSRVFVAQSDTGVLVRLLRAGDVVAGDFGLPSGQIDSIGLPAGRHALRSVVPVRLRGSLIDEFNRDAIMLFTSGGVSVLARQGAPTPGGPAGAIIGSIPSATPGGVMMSDDGSPGFVATLAVGPGGVTAENATAIFGPVSGGGTGIVLRQGTQLPGAASGVVLDRVLGVAMSSGGDFVSHWTLRGPGVSSPNGTALVFSPRGGTPGTVCRAGHSLEVAAGQWRTIQQIRFEGVTSGGEGLSTPLGAARDLAVRLEFTDDSHALVRARLPVAISSPSCVSFVSSPMDQLVNIGATVILNATAQGAAPLQLRWRKNGIDLVDGEGISGSTTATLTISDAKVTDSGSYQLRATNSCAAVLSAPAWIDVPGCLADFNRDDQVDFFDYLDFAEAFATETSRADFNRDGQVDFFDYLDFVSAFADECP